MQYFVKLTLVERKTTFFPYKLINEIVYTMHLWFYSPFRDKNNLLLIEKLTTIL